LPPRLVPLIRLILETQSLWFAASMPYDPHVECVLPPPETIIWRYIDFAKYVSMIQLGYVFFSSVRVLAKKDKWEAVFPERWKEAWIRKLGDSAGAPDLILKRSREYLDARACVNCWHINETESDAMWRLYANGTSNLVIRSTVERLCNSFSVTPKPVHVGQVEYIDFENCDFDDRIKDRILNITPALLWKRPGFKHEQELRAIYYASLDLKSNGVLITADMPTLIEKVVISPQSETWLDNLVRSVTNKFGYTKIPVERSKWDDAPA
jgi:hypothetical protein